MKSSSSAGAPSGTSRRCRLVNWCIFIPANDWAQDPVRLGGIFLRCCSQRLNISARYFTKCEILISCPKSTKSQTVLEWTDLISSSQLNSSHLSPVFKRKHSILAVNTPALTRIPIKYIHKPLSFSVSHSSHTPLIPEDCFGLIFVQKGMI